MKKIATILLFTLLAACMLLCFTACDTGTQQTSEPTDPGLDEFDVTDFALVATDASELAALEQYPVLKNLDLRGSSCYDAILDYIRSHPNVSVEYDVQIGNARYDQNVSELTLAEGDYEFDQLIRNLAYLPNAAKLVLPKTDLSADQLHQIRDTYPQLKLDYTVMLMGEELNGDVSQIDISQLEPDQIDGIIEPLSKLHALENIQLMDASGTGKLSPVDVRKIMDAAPNATVLYSFELFGKVLSTTDETVEYVGTYIGNDGIDQVRQALDILPNCKYFKMDRCSVDNEVMAQLRDDYPNVKIVWRVFFAYYNCLTDVEMIHCTDDLDDRNVEVLKYCTDIVYLDIGHNFGLHNIDFINYMPKLKVAIIVDCAAPSLEPFANCPDLEWLEIVNCSQIKDLSPLANCTKLKGLNMSADFAIKDLSPLYGLKNMERLYLGWHILPQDQIDAIFEHLPDCWITTERRGTEAVSYNYGIGWRIDEDGDRADWYKEIRVIFRYAENYYNHDD